MGQASGRACTHDRFLDNARVDADAPGTDIADAYSSVCQRCPVIVTTAGPGARTADACMCYTKTSDLELSLTCTKLYCSVGYSCLLHD